MNEAISDYNGDSQFHANDDDDELSSKDEPTMPSLESVEQPEEEGNVDRNASDNDEAPQ